MAYRFDAVVIGAGVVGLACASRLARTGLTTLLIERERSIGQGISSRNSEVIHAGLYYRPGTHKSKLCRKGAEQLYSYCDRRNVAYRKIGKLVVATNTNQIDILGSLYQRSLENGCDVQMLTARQASNLEPNLHAVSALSSPDTGIIDSHGLMGALRNDFECAGGVVLLNTSVVKGEATRDSIRLWLNDQEQTEVCSNIVVNSTGLDSPLVAESIIGVPRDCIPERCFAKGNYFSLTGQSPFSRLIYPVPEHGGLGVHMTLDLQGQARFGPDVEWVDSPEYVVNENRYKIFEEAIKIYWPEFNRARLRPGYVGIRPKLGTPENFQDDFLIQSEDTHGVSGLINLMGIESPGLTSCLAIADLVADRLGLDSLKE